MKRQQITVLGATGSIGMSTLDVVSRHRERYAVFALSAQRRIKELAQLCRQHHPQFAVVPDDNARRELLRLVSVDSDCASQLEVLVGEQALADIASAPQVDSVMAAIVGAAGLKSSLAAARAGKRVLLANKESLVCAGELFMQTCRENGASLLPIDSEHNAVFQCLTQLPAPAKLPQVPNGVRKVILTASGGPFRTWSMAAMSEVTPAQACAHPNWAMGQKISVDSASMMNKGLELIEAHYLFGLPASALEVVVHPQSIVHSMVEYADGSVLAQMGNPDMRTPIAQALAYPDRIDSGVNTLQLTQIGRLDFEAPDAVRFPCLALAQQAMQIGAAAPCVLNAANEVTVAAFLGKRLRFTDIAQLNARVLERLGQQSAARTFDAVIALDQQARSYAHELIKGRN